MAAFETAFGMLGYEKCADDSLEDGFEKIALYASPAGEPKHAARQLPDGMWTSKLGPQEDISHTTPNGVTGAAYGEVFMIMRRAKSETT